MRSSLQPHVRTRARLLLAVVLGLIGWSVATGSAVDSRPPQADPSITDLGLYEDIAVRVSAGEGYYAAAVAEQTKQGFPVQPGATVRLPTTTWVTTTLGQDGAQVLLYGLAVIAVGLALVRFERLTRTRLQWAGAMLLLFAAIVVVLAPGGTYFSETWAALLLLVATLVDPRRHPWAGLALIVAAVCFRELALLSMVPVAVLLWRSAQRHAAAAWLAASAVLAVAYLTIHFDRVAEAVAVADLTDVRESGGWVELGGWPLVVDFLRRITLLDLLPFWVAAVVVPLALLGLVLRRSPTTTAMAVGASGFLIAFMVIGRPDTAYWGLLYAPLILPGLAFAPSAVRELVRTSLSRAT